MTCRNLTSAELKIGALLFPERNYWRPVTRADCSNVGRPCPYTSCRHHMYLDVAPSGSIVLNFPDIEPWEMPSKGTCALDLAEENLTLEEIGRLMNITRERVRQIQAKAFSRLQASKASHIVEWLKSRE